MVSLKEPLKGIPFGSIIRFRASRIRAAAGVTPGLGRPSRSLPRKLFAGLVSGLSVLWIKPQGFEVLGFGV